MKQSCLILMLALLLGCGTTGFSSPPGNNPAQPKKTDIHSTPKMGGGVSMRVLWTVSEYKLGADAVWGKKEADTLLFKPLHMDANSITFDGKSCRDVTFKKETVKTKEYLDYLHTTAQALGFTDDVIEVTKTNCNMPGFAEYMRLKDRRLVIHINGVFFFLEPTINY